MKLGFCPSGQDHNSYVFGQTNEHAVMAQICEWAVKETIAQGHQARTFSIIEEADLSGIHEQAKEVNAWGADYVITPHSNASAGYSLGVMGLIHNESRRAWASELLANFRNYTKLPDKGLTLRPGLIILNSTTAPCLLVEINAHDTVAGAQTNIRSMEFYGRSLAKSAILAAGGTLVTDPVNPIPLPSDWTPEAARLKSLGILKGNADGSFNPSAPATRQQVAVLLCALIDKYGLK